MDNWGAIRRAARMTGTPRQRLLQKVLDGIRFVAAQGGGFAGQAIASKAIKKILVRHN
jgi:hypothetical protein